MRVSREKQMDLKLYFKYTVRLRVKFDVRLDANEFYTDGSWRSLGSFQRAP